MTPTKVKMSTLRLVYPPMSNLEATWAPNDPEWIAALKQSDFYMIGGRAEANFVCNTVKPNKKAPGISIVLKMGKVKARVVLNFAELPFVKGTLGKMTLDIDIGPKLIRIWEDVESGEPTNCIEWFTSEKLLWDYWNGMPGIYGLENYREFATYDLLYVGIAKKTDTYERLINKGHTARQDILSKEPQRYPGARVTDEIILFCYKVEPLIVQMWSSLDKVKASDLGSGYDQKAIVRDAEKAFINLLKPEYNKEQFVNYPKGTDGLYKSGYTKYGYALGEDIIFNTTHSQIRGAWNADMQIAANDADLIFIEGDKVSLMKPGANTP